MADQHLLSIVAALGGYEGTPSVYVPGEEVLDCLRDLKKILRGDNDTPDRSVFLTLGRWSVLQSHLLPILLVSGKNDKLDKENKLAENDKLGFSVDDFLKNSFNALMRTVKKDINRERAGQLMGREEAKQSKIADSEGSEFDFDTVTEFMNLQGVSFVLRRIQEYADGKHKFAELHNTINCFKQMLLSIDAMAATEKDWKDHAAIIQNNLFYEYSTVDMLVGLCKSFNSTKQTAGYLKSLVETIHFFLRSLERYSQQKGRIVVRKRKRQKKPKAGADGEVVDDLESDTEKKPEAFVEKDFEFESIERVGFRHLNGR
ncbi:hypothetical protein HK101_007023 [Irineochytrium annulatum]|nr:hypothetical protein HK101_007023 [Irineochytrium annulatum]